MLNLVWCLVSAARLLLATSFGRRVKELRIKEVHTAPRSPSQGRELGRVVELPEVGGLHHRHVREAA